MQALRRRWALQAVVETARLDVFMWRTRSPDGRHAVLSLAHAAAKVVLCHVPVHDDAPRRSGERATTATLG